MAGSSRQVGHVRVEFGGPFGVSRATARLQRKLVNAAIRITGDDQLDVAQLPYRELAAQRKRIVLDAHKAHLRDTANYVPDA